jgi:hypothetical protein
LDGDQGASDDCWAEGSGWWNGVGLDQVEEVKEGIRVLEEGLRSSKYRAGEVQVSSEGTSRAELTKQSASLLLAYHYCAIGDHKNALATYESVSWDGDARAGIVGGEAAVLDRIRGRCLQGTL